MSSDKKTKRQIPVKDQLADRIVGGSYSELANYSDLFKRTQDGILLVDPHTLEVLEANPAAGRFFSVSTQGLLGHTIFSLFGEVEGSKIIETQTGSLMDVVFHTSVFECAVDRLRLADYCEVKQIILTDVTEIRQARALLENQSLSDEMTGLRNFRSFKSRLELEFQRAKNKGSVFSVIFCDIDHFKIFNDKNGHPAGDEALRRVAKIIDQVAGKDHFVARYGGEEFVVLCSSLDHQGAMNVAEAIRTQIESTVIPFGENQPMGKVTLSLGISDSSGAPSADHVLKSADDALYQSKKNGRNQATSFAALKKVA
jgi:diguanylate cyclase (GGDEF)-like protein